MQVEQLIFRSWESASQFLLMESSELAPGQCARSHLLDPTDIRIEWTKGAQLNLDSDVATTIDFRPVNLSLDYKDVELLYSLSKRFKQIIVPSTQVFVDEYSAKLNELKDRMQEGFKNALNESLFARKQGDADDDLEDSDEDGMDA